MSVASSYIHIHKVDLWGEETLMLADILLWNSSELWVFVFVWATWKKGESHKGCGFIFFGGLSVFEGLLINFWSYLLYSVIILRDVD